MHELNGVIASLLTRVIVMVHTGSGGCMYVCSRVYCVDGELGGDCFVLMCYIHTYRGGHAVVCDGGDGPRAGGGRGQVGLVV